MLAYKDLFEYDETITDSKIDLSEIEILPVLQYSIELFKSELWEDVLTLTSEYLGTILRKSSLSESEQQLLALVAYSKSNLAVADSNFSMACDWLISGINRCEPQNDPTFEQPLAYRYLLLAAGAVASANTLTAEPSQVHIILSEEAFAELSIAYIRLAPFGKERLRQATNGTEPLRNRILDRLWEYEEVSSGRRRSATNVAEVAYQCFIKGFQDVCNTGNQVILVKSPGSELRKRGTDFIKAIEHSSQFQLSFEKDDANRLKGILGKPLTVLAESHAAIDPLTTRENLVKLIDRATETLGFYDRRGLITRSALYPALKHIRDLAIDSVGLAEFSFQPSVITNQTVKRYPLDKAGNTFNLRIELVNEGKGVAEHVQVRFKSPPNDPISFTRAMPLEVGTLLPGKSINVECPVTVNTPLDVVSLPVSVSYSNIFNKISTLEEMLVIERQTLEPDWEELITMAPYALRPVATLDRLRGRADQLNALRLNIAMGTSVILWGQKRVGKTSIAQVLMNEILEQSKYHTIYLRRGSISGFSEGQIAREIALKIASTITDLELKVPDETWFGPYLTRLSSWIEEVRNKGFRNPIVIIIDEFDELNPAMYMGQRGNNFAATLRSLSEQHVTWVFVGGERMPSIFLRHHSTFNQVETSRVDRISRTSEVEDMISGVVKGKLEWEPEAIDLVRHFTAGNPYYVNLLCGRVLREMHNSRRTFVDRTDVQVARSTILEEASPTHWGHFWEDNSEVDQIKRVKLAHGSVIFLSAMGISMEGKQVVSVSLSAITDSLRQLGDSECLKIEEVLEAGDNLVKRGVLVESQIGSELHYSTTIPLFGEFLQHHSKMVVFPYHEHYHLEEEIHSEFHTSTPVRVDTFPVDEDELISVSDGFYYLGNPIDAVRIRAWLKQYPDEAAIVLAAKLLKRLKDSYYFDLNQIRHAIDDSYTWLTSQMRESGVKTLEVSGPKGRIANIHLAYLGKASESGAEVAREFKNQKRIARCSDVKAALDFIKERKADERKQNIVYIVDDFVGTGDQARKSLSIVTNRIRKDKELFDWASSGKLFFSPLWAFTSGIDTFKDEIDDIVRIQPSRNLSDEDRAFSGSSNLYETEEERRYAESVFRHIGQQLLPDNPLGWGNCQALVAFENTIPNNTLPAFWLHGIVDEKRWTPLLPRP